MTENKNGCGMNKCGTDKRGTNGCGSADPADSAKYFGELPLLSEIKYDSNGLVTVVVQDAVTKEVLMTAWSDEAAVLETVRTGYAHFYSRSRGRMWKKGEESGHLQKIVRILIDCDCDTLLYQVGQTGGACHTGHMSCFYRTLAGEDVGEIVFDPAKVYANSK